MTAVVQALLWKYWRRTSRLLVLQLLGATALAIAVDTVFPVDFDAVEKAEIMKVAIWLSLSMLYVSVSKPSNSNRSTLGGEGYPYREDFSAPISTNLLVFLPMAFYALVYVAAFAIPMAFMQIFFGLGELALRDCLQIVVLFVCIACISWGVGNLTEHAIGWVIFMALMYYRIIIPDFGANATSQITAEQIVLPIAAFLVALFVLKIGVSRQRHGESLLSGLNILKADWGAVTAREFIPLLKWRCPKGSPLKALFWKEQQLRGVPLAMAYALFIGITIVIVLNILVRTGEAESGEILTVATLMSFSMLFTFSFSLFGVSYKNGKGRVSTFDRTIAIDTAPYLLVKCAVSLLSLLVGFLTVYLVVTALGYLSLDEFDLIPEEAAQRIGRFFAQPSADWILQAVKFFIVIVTALLLSGSYLTHMALERKFATRITLGLFLYGFLFVLFAAVTQDGVVAFREFTRGVIPKHLWLFIVLLPAFVCVGASYLLKDHVLSSKQLLIVLLVACVIAAISPFSWMSPGGSGQPLESIIAGYMAGFLPLAAVVAGLWTLNSLRHG